jgi:hypothetical protein
MGHGGSIMLCVHLVELEPPTLALESALVKGSQEAGTFSLSSDLEPSLPNLEFR